VAEGDAVLLGVKRRRSALQEHAEQERRSERTPERAAEAELPFRWAHGIELTLLLHVKSQS
jgi:hypothetical protein